MKKESMAATDSLPIDKLAQDINQISTQKTHLNREDIDHIFLRLRHEIPYSTRIITGTLAANLLSDSSHPEADLSLNAVIANLGKALFNPDQNDSLEQLVQNYLSTRKKTEKEYALAIGGALIKIHDLKEFPERARPTLQELAYALMEKLINEKQSRKIPGYKPQSILELISPILHHRMHPEIERVKTGQPQVLRQWLNTIAHEGYEKVSDEKILAVVHNEKENAFKTFKKALATKFPGPEAMEKYLQTLRFLQIDRDTHHQKLNAMLDEFLKPDVAALSRELSARCHEKLRRLFNVADKNTEIYHSEDMIRTTHEQVFSEMEYEVTALRKIIVTINTIKNNYSKNLLQAVIGIKNINLLKNAELDALLGPGVMKIDPATQKTKMLREGGYPQKNLTEIYTAIINQLENINSNLSGLFVDKLRKEIDWGISDLRLANSELRVVKLVPAETTPKVAVKPDLSAHEVIPFPTIEEPKPKAEEQRPKVAEPKPETEAPKPKAADLKPETEAPKPKAADLKPETGAPKPKAEDLKPETEVKAAPTAAFATKLADGATTVTESLAKTEQQTYVPPKEQAPQPAPAVEPPPLKIEETFFDELEDFKLEPAKPQAQPGEPAERTEPTFESNPEGPNPLLNIESFDTEPSLEIAPQSPPKIETPATEAGILIMKNYQLGEFEKPVEAAWKKMQASTSTEAENGELIPNENEIRLYVICDLAQQVESINPANLSDVNKEILHSVKELLLLALNDPSSEDNWTFFEGPHRDEIDKAIAGLRSGQ